MTVTNPVYPSVTLIAYIGSTPAWTNITSDTVGDIGANWGISGASENDRIADTGELRFTLDNSTGKYTPFHTSAITGWGKGTPIYFYITYENLTYYRFRGWVESIDIDTGQYGRRYVNVTVVDWMDTAAELPLSGLTLELNKTADQALTSIVLKIPRPPLRSLFDVGETTYPVVFDTLDGKTRAYKEMAKIALSEMGYIYLRRERAASPEILVFENATHRNGLSTLSQVAYGAESAGILLKEDGDALLTESGNTLVLDGDMHDALFDNTMMGMEITYGQDLFNSVKMRVYPKRTDGTAQILYSLNSAMQLAPAGMPNEFHVTYRDPEGGNARVTGINMISPAGTVDYQMWTNSDGTGTDLTSQLTVAATYEADGVNYAVQNTGGTTAYMTKLQARGYGIYAYNPLEYIAEDSASQTANGEYEQVIDQKYQITMDKARVSGDAVLDQYKNPRTVVNSVTFNANSSSELMLSFLNLDVGDLIRLKEAQSAVDGWYWIQSVQFVCKPGGVIYFTWGLKEHNSLLSGALELVQFEPQSGTTGAIQFGYLPRASNLSQRSYSAWIYKSNPGTYIFSAPYSDYAGVALGASNNFVHPQGTIPAGYASFYYRQLYTGPNVLVALSDILAANKNLIPLNSWCHLVVTVDHATDPRAYPLCYINGTYSPLYIDAFPSSPNVPGDEGGGAFTIGNINGEVEDYSSPFGGALKDLRLYNRILSPAEVLALYQAGIGGGTTDGLVFHGPCVYKSRRANFDNKIITASDMLVDNAYGAVGIPIANVKTVLLT